MSQPEPVVRAEVSAQRDGVTWTARGRAIEGSGERGNQRVELPAGIKITGLEVGYDGTVFAADAAAARVYTVREGEAAVLAEGEALAGAGPLVLYGGRLVVGTAGGLRAVKLATAEVETIAPVGAVAGVAVDHVGYFAVVTAEPPRALRVTPGGQVTELPLALPGAGPIRFDDRTRTLHLTDAATGTTSVHDYLAAVGDDAALWARRDARPMRPFQHNGVVLEGAEYWPNVGDQPTRYPDDVLWGFYPEAGVVFEGEAARATPTPAAMACAHTAYDRLRAWAERPPQAWYAAARARGSHRFYLWTNDYSQAADPFPHDVRPAAFWYWERKPAVVGRVPGFWKWESTVTQDGVCHTPDPAQIEQYLTAP